MKTIDNWVYDTESSLNVAVVNILKDRLDSDDEISSLITDLERGGCKSGIIPALSERQDALKFFDDHESEIIELLVKPVSVVDDEYRNLFAWYAFETKAITLAKENGFN